LSRGSISPLPTLPPLAGEGREGKAKMMDTRVKPAHDDRVNQINREPPQAAELRTIC